MRPFDVSKFRRDIIKSIPGLSVGFHDPSTWIDSGNYALNYAISGNFNRGIPLGKVTMFAGESGSGKSFLCSGNIVRNAQKNNIFPIIIDTEQALDEKWLHALGVDTSDDNLLKVNVSQIDEVAKFISDIMKKYKEDNEKIDKIDRPKILFVIDSLGMLDTPVGVAQFEAGDLKGDFGRKPKALAALVRNCVNTFGEYDVGLVVTNHTYASQDPFDPDDKISGGGGFIFASSIVVAMRKLKLKEDEDGKKVTDTRGIRAMCKVMKTRFNKPFESVEIKIPWDRGMDRYSGLIDLFEKKNILIKEGNKLKYTDSEGNEHKYFRSQISDDLLDLIMLEWDENKNLQKVTPNVNNEVEKNVAE